MSERARKFRIAFNVDYYKEHKKYPDTEVIMQAYVDSELERLGARTKNPTLEDVKSILSHFNKVRAKLRKRGYNLEKIGKTHLRFITSRLRDGATVEEMKAVIDMKEKDWLHDPVMKKYLRVETVFNKTKYNMYVQELPIEQDNSKMKIGSIKRQLNNNFGRRGIKNEKSDALAKELIDLGYDNKEFLNMYLLNNK